MLTTLMVTVMVTAFVFGILVWVVGVTIALTDFCDNKIYRDAFAILIFYGLMGFLIQSPALYRPIQDVTVRSHAPISVIKTNDETIVIYRNFRGKVNLETFNDAKYWNSTNILVKYNIGRNIYGTEIMSGTRLCAE